MDLLNPINMLLLVQVVSLVFYGFLMVVLVKLAIVLFKADRFMDEVRAYMRGQQPPTK